MHVVQAMAVIHYTQSRTDEYIDFFAKVLFGCGGTLQGNLGNDAETGHSYSSICQLRSYIWL